MKYRSGLTHTRVRRFEFDNGKPGVYGVVVIETPAASIQVMISPTGKSTQVHVDSEQVWKGSS